MRHVLAITLALTAAGLLGASAHANSISITNQGFETPGTLSTTTPTGWTTVNAGATGTVGSYNPYELGGGNVYYLGANSTTDPVKGGSGYPGIFDENLGFASNVSAGSGLEQTLSATFLADTAYKLTVNVGTRNGTDAGGFAGSVIELLAGSTVIASSTDTTGPTAGTFLDQVALLANSNVDPALFGQTLSINILTTNAARVNRSTDWDNVRLDATFVPAAVPLPPAFATGAICLVAILGSAWRPNRRSVRPL